MSEEEFNIMFPDEESCIAYFRKIREDMGNACPKCGCTSSYYVNYNNCWRFKCNHVKTLRSGTVMQASKLSYKTWLTAIYYMSSSERSMPANEFKEKLGINTPNHVRIVQMRIRDAMSKYLKDHKIIRRIGKDALTQINFIYKGVADENLQYYIDEYIFKHRPENADEKGFENLVKACLNYSTEVKLKR